ncbi:MAG: 50S ribosomal protein L18 [Spirochaetes bacterium]|nr:50S ribosomal protein L18 [Spirochaetota bacterium]
MNRLELKKIQRAKRKLRVKAKIFGTPTRPRLTVYRSNKHLYIQVIDDTKGHTLASVSSLEKEFRDMRNNVSNAEKLGQIIGERTKKLNIHSVVFDRNGYLYHGIVKAVAEGARKAGLEF